MNGNHLTSDELSALLDHRLAGAALEQAERHLAGCAECAAAYAALAAQDQALRRAFTHDPGEEYFASFAARVAARISAGEPAGAPRPASATPAERRAATVSGQRAPRRSLAWASALAAAVVAVGIAFLLTRESGVVSLRDRGAVERAERDARARPPAEEAPAPEASPTPGEVAAPAPAPVAQGRLKSQAPERATTSGAPSGAAASGAAKERAAPGFAAAPPGAGAAGNGPAAAPGALPGRAYEVRRDERGEDVPVIPPGSPAASYRPPPAPPAAPARPGEPVYVRKYSPAVPMQARDAGGSQNLAPSAQGFAQAPPADSARIEVCGVVGDPSGRPIASASVVITETGASATTDPHGRFCLAAPAGDRTLAVLAVGYAAARQSIHVTAGVPATSVVLQPVQVLGGAAGTDPVALRSAAFAGLPDSLAAVARRASTLTLGAPALHSATTWEMAADQWSLLVVARPRGPAEDEALFQLAVARLRAWELSPNEERRQGALQAVETYLVSAKPGPRRELAQSWQTRIGP